MFDVCVTFVSIVIAYLFGYWSCRSKYSSIINTLMNELRKEKSSGTKIV